MLAAEIEPGQLPVRIGGSAYSNPVARIKKNPFKCLILQFTIKFIQIE